MRTTLSSIALAAALCLSAWGCGEAVDDGPTEEARLAALPYAKNVVSFEPGEGAGHGQARLPDIVLGPPGSSTQVLSLGSGGEVVVDFGDRAVVDGEGADFIVFENPFETPIEDDGIWQELGEVSVSTDGETWTRFSCDPAPNEASEWPGCAGWRPVEDYDPLAVVPLEPEKTGGDAFDLADIGVEEARYIRIRDLSEEPNNSKSAGFDLNAVGLIHHTDSKKEAN
ncbi:MAG: cell surface protein [Myxococcota bacterium]